MEETTKKYPNVDTKNAQSPTTPKSTTPKPTPSKIDQSTYGDTGVGTKTTGAGSSGGFGSTGGSPGSGSSDYGVSSHNVSSKQPGTEFEYSTDQDRPLGATQADMKGFDSKKDSSSTRDRDVGAREGNGSTLQSSILKQINDLGDLIERAGEKIEKAGFTKIGEAIYRLGDRIEHFREGSSRSTRADDSVETDQPPRSTL